MLAAMPRSTAKLNLCINQNISRWSPVAPVNLWPISLCYLSRHCSTCRFNCHCFEIIRVRQGSIFSSFEPACTSLSFTSVDAKLSTQVQSRHMGFPCLYVHIVMTSGFPLSSLERPGGSCSHGTPAVWWTLWLHHSIRQVCQHKTCTSGYGGHVCSHYLRTYKYVVRIPEF